MKKDKLLLSALILALFLLISGCQTSGGESTTVAEVIPTEVPTETVTPLPEPTDTPTAEPTDTPTPVPTDTPTIEPTDTPTPKPTDTPNPEPTNTPTTEPTAVPTTEPTETSADTPTATPPPVSDDPTPTEEPATTEEPEQPDSITIFYLSDPNEILGTFPVREFDANALYNNMTQVRNSLNTMSGALVGARQGDAAACATYVQAYNNILYSGIFYEPVPPAWQEIDGIYFLSFVYSLDRTRPAFLSCQNAGNVDQFNGDLAAMTIEETLGLLNQAIAAAAGML
jgi:hypothetical protein